MSSGTLLLAATQHAQAAAHHAAAHAHHAYGPWGHGCHHHHPILITLGVIFLVYLIVRLVMRAFFFRRFGHFARHGGFHGRRCGHSHGYGPEGWGGHGPHGGGFGFRRSPMHFVFDRLETSTSQEKVIRQAIDELRDKARDLRGSARNVRDDVAKAFGAESFDQEAIEAAFAVPEAKLPELRRAITAALAKVHEALTAEQRKELASMMTWGPRFFR